MIKIKMNYNRVRHIKWFPKKKTKPKKKKVNEWNVINANDLFMFWFSGPIQFPAPPTDGPVESSGVIVGASGYGFVPPSSQQSKL